MITREIGTQVLLFLCVLTAAYFVLIRPQLKRITKHRQFLTSLKPGDRIVTGGGLIGTVVSCDGNDVVEIELCNAIRVQALRNSLQSRIEGHERSHGHP